MVEYIDREVVTEQTDEVLRLLNDIQSGGRLGYGDYCELFDAVCEISALPPANVRENVPGHWIFTPNRGYACSACDGSVGYDSQSNFCPNCGVDMRGGTK